MYSYSEIVNELLKEFPEISGRYAGELAWIQDTFQGQGQRQIKPLDGLLDHVF